MLVPLAGPLAGQTSVTITGAALTGATAVKFGTLDAVSFSVTNSTTMNAVSPAAVAGSVHVIVTTPGGGFPTATGKFEFWSKRLEELGH